MTQGGVCVIIEEVRRGLSIIKGRTDIIPAVEITTCVVPRSTGSALKSKKIAVQGLRPEASSRLPSKLLGRPSSKTTIPKGIPFCKPVITNLVARDAEVPELEGQMEEGGGLRSLVLLRWTLVSYMYANRVAIEVANMTVVRNVK